MYRVTDPTKKLSSTEEYLQTIAYLIENKSLSSRTSIILEDMYVKYKLNKGYKIKYCPGRWTDHSREDSIKIIKCYDTHKQTTPIADICIFVKIYNNDSRKIVRSE